MKSFNFDPPWFVPLILFLAALLVGLIKVRNLWEEMHDDDDPASDRERLSELEEAHAAGELDEEELRRVRALLSGTSSSPPTPEPLRRTPVQPDPAPADRGNSSSTGDAPAEPDSP